MFVNACIQVDFFLHAAKSNINTPTTAKHQDLHASTDTSSLHSALKIKGGSDIYWGAFFLFSTSSTVLPPVGSTEEVLGTLHS